MIHNRRWSFKLIRIHVNPLSIEMTSISDICLKIQCIQCIGEGRCIYLVDKHMKRCSHTLFARIIQTSFCQRVSWFAWMIFRNLLLLLTDTTQTQAQTVVFIQDFDALDE